MPQNDKNCNVGDTIQTSKKSHIERLKAVEHVLKYFEHQGSSVIDLPLLRGEAANHRVQYRIQHDNTHFGKISGEPTPLATNRKKAPSQNKMAPSETDNGGK
ncbi:hypothetical protein TNCV_515521 [Trichonephila clavipes]|nr:hypothetical protein TNCV_515521 [Trichonephila clavipes]